MVFLCQKRATEYSRQSGAGEVEILVYTLWKIFLKGNRHLILVKIGKPEQPIFSSSFESSSVSEDQTIHFAAYNSGTH